MPATELMMLTWHCPFASVGPQLSAPVKVALPPESVNPTVAPGTARLRISVNVGLSEDILDGFVKCLVEKLCAVHS